MSTLPPGLHPVDDLGPSLWVQEALREWPSGPLRVRDLVSPVRGVRADPPSPSQTGGHPGSHGDLGGTRARKERRPADTRWEELEPAGDYRWSLHEGTVSEEEVTTLVDLFGPDAGDCWFAVWSGFARPPARAAYLLAGGSLRQRAASAMIRVRERSAAARARMSARRLSTFPLLSGGRSYILFGGSIQEAVRLHREFEFHPPTLWWPENRAWFVHTEIDASSTYVGGTVAMIGRLVGEQILESFEVDSDTPAAL